MPGAPPPPRDCSLPSDPTCPSLWLPIFSRSASDPITVSLFLLILSLSLQLSLPGCVPLHLFLCLPPFVSPSLYIALPRCASLYKCLSLSLSFSPLPFPGSIPILCLAAPGVLQQSNGTAWGHLGALPRVPFPVTSTRPSPWRGLLLPSAAVRRGGGARVGRHSAQHLLGSPGAPDPLCRY